MSKRTIFKKKRKSERKDVALTRKQEKPQKQEEGYKMKSDFMNLGIIITLFLVALASIYYFDQQNNFLSTLPQTLGNLFK